MKGIIVLFYALMLATTACSKKKGPSSNSYLEASTDQIIEDVQDGSNPNNDIINNPGNDNPGNDNPGNDNPGNDNPGNDNPGNDNPGNDNPGNDNPGNDDPHQAGIYFPENGRKHVDFDPDCRDGFKVLNGVKLRCTDNVKQRIFTVVDCKSKECQEDVIQKKIKKRKRKYKKKQKTQKVVKKEKKDGPSWWERIFGKKKEKTKKKEKKQKVAKEKKQKKKKQKVAKEKKQKEAKKRVVKKYKKKVKKKKKVVQKEKRESRKRVTKKNKERKKKKKKVVKKEKKDKKRVAKKKKDQKKSKKKVVDIKKKKIKIVKKKKYQKEDKKKVVVTPERPKIKHVTTIKAAGIASMGLEKPSGEIIQTPIFVDVKPEVVEEPKEARDKKANPAELVEGITTEFGVETDNLDVESVRNKSLAMKSIHTRFRNLGVCEMDQPLEAVDFVKLNSKGYPIDLNRTLNLNDVTLVNLDDNREQVIADLVLDSLFADILSVSVRSSDMTFDTNPKELQTEIPGEVSFDYESYRVTPGTTVDTFLHKGSTVIRDVDGSKLGSRKVTIYFTKDQILGLELQATDGSETKTYCLEN